MTFLPSIPSSHGLFMLCTHFSVRLGRFFSRKLASVDIKLLHVGPKVAFGWASILPFHLMLAQFGDSGLFSSSEFFVDVWIFWHVAKWLAQKMSHRASKMSFFAWVGVN